MKKWKTIVKPRTGIWEWPVKEIWKYRNLMGMLVKRNYEIQYKQTILGPFWIVFGQIFSAGIFSLLFGYVGRFSSEGIPYYLFYMSGNVIWSYFSGCVTSNSTVFLSNAYLFGKVYFPRLIVPFANCIFEAIRSGVQFLVCFAVWLFFFFKGEVPFMGWYMLIMPFLFLEMMLIGMAVGMIISSLTTKYRDLMHLTNIGIQLLMYASPVLYPISQLPDSVQKIVLLNPIASIVEAFRYCLTGCGVLRLNSLIYSAVFSVVIWVISVIQFNQTEKNFIDII